MRGDLVGVSCAPFDHKGRSASRHRPTLRSASSQHATPMEKHVCGSECFNDRKKSRVNLMAR